MSLKDLLMERTHHENELAKNQEALKALNIDIEHLLAESLASLRKLSGKEHGAVNLLQDGIKITETIPKKVEWDQEKMNEIFDRIAASGDDPRAYVKMKLEVSEKSYDAFSDGIKAVFADARTVKFGRPVLKFDMEAINA